VKKSICEAERKYTFKTYMNSNRLIYWHLEKIGWNSENNYMVVYLYFVLLA
jgi:hypothetical protein